MRDVGVILAAAGSGSRMGRDKLMLKLGEYTVLQRSALAFASCPDICGMAAVTRPDLLDTVRQQLEALSLPFPVWVVPGGATRQQSVAAGVKAMPAQAMYYAIHDAAGLWSLPRRSPAAWRTPSGTGGLPVRPGEGYHPAGGR